MIFSDYGRLFSHSSTSTQMGSGLDQRPMDHILRIIGSNCHTGLLEKLGKVLHIPHRDIVIQPVDEEERRLAAIHT